MKAGVRLLLFVALLLPFRGAMALGGFLCHSSTSHDSVAVARATSAAHSHESHGASGHHQHHQAEYAQLQVADSHPGGDSPSCNLCSAVCSAPPLSSPGLAVHALFPSGAERFPAVALVRSSVSLDGLERPPRTL